MKRHFGTFLTRSFFGAGTSLTDIEHRMIEELISSLPDWLRATVETQIDAYDLVQREVDGRALNFYRKRSGTSDCMDGLLTLEMHGDEAPLMKITVQLGDEPEPVHATLNAVSGRVFCVAFSRRVDGIPSAATVAVTDRKDSWRSNFHRPNNQSEQYVGEQPAISTSIS
jgi:hypothetical protein